MIIIVPITSGRAAQTYTDDNNIEFSPHMWRNGIPDPNITDWGHAIHCSADGSRPTTHLMLWGDLTAGQARGMKDNITDCAAYPEPQYTRATALADMGLQRVSEEEPTSDHLMVMPTMHKITDMADAPFPVTQDVAQSDKWDGYTCTMKYDSGNLVAGITQGDGIKGRDRIARLSLMAPATLNRPATMQVEGEVICTTRKPRDAYHALEYSTDREFERYDCKFLAFDVRGAGFTTWTDAMNWLDSQGFDTVLNYVDDDYPKDGRVYRIDNYADYEAAEVGQFALKYY